MKEQRLLLVEDDDSLRLVLTRELKRMGFGVVAHPRGDGVPPLLRQHEFDAVVLDLNLPGTPGMDVLAQVVAHDAELPVVVITSLLARHFVNLTEHG